MIVTHPEKEELQRPATQIMGREMKESSTP
jgi:hypothetical protein